mmetsp:Transcript_47115/g.118675  ORF Transcript_47115/g.118675 Transcript_47115/m.118675 type:complete len:231 (-) Transcript_47115:1551-2243(-)
MIDHMSARCSTGLTCRFSFPSTTTSMAAAPMSLRPPPVLTPPAPPVVVAAVAALLVASAAQGAAAAAAALPQRPCLPRVAQNTRHAAPRCPSGRDSVALMGGAACRVAARAAGGRRSSHLSTMAAASGAGTVRAIHQSVRGPATKAVAVAPQVALLRARRRCMAVAAAAAGPSGASGAATGANEANESASGTTTEAVTIMAISPTEAMPPVMGQATASTTGSIQTSAVTA